ncbi:MAG: hypothetical protein NTV15_01750, partial [Candidatus Bathyarchaeota archaeon]|nr:hypothetical protein [Candidatus Bathyarchaeota archaeon]
MSNAQDTGEGTFWLETSVFPLLDFKKVAGEVPISVEYKGTCFLMMLAQNPVFVAPKHLLVETPDKYNLHIAYNTPNGRPSYLKVRAVYANHDRQDISFFVPTAAMMEECCHRLVPMELLRHPLTVGQGVLVYGFPNSEIAADGQVPILNIQRTRYEGKVLRVEEDHPFTRIQKIYYLDFP